MAYRPATKPLVDSHQPPQSIEAERAVLGAILKDEDAINRVIDVIRDSSDFYVKKHQFIFQAMIAMYDRSEPCDITTVVIELQKKELLEKIGGRLYLVELVEQIASAGNVATYANHVMESAVLRRLIATSNEISQSCYAADMPVEELLDRAESHIFQISESRLRQGFVPLKGIITHTLEEIDSMDKSDGGLSGLRTGYHDLDAKTLGFHRGDLIIIAGRPSMGKTALAMNIAEFAAVDQKKSVGIFSVEMSKEALVFRMLCGRARVSQHRVRRGDLPAADWPRLSTAGNVLSQAPIFVDDSPTLSPLDLRAKGRRLKAQYGLDLLIVDYIQLMHSTGRVENRQQEISNISRNLKGLAKELDVPVVALSQLSRAVEQRTGEKRPQLSDLRESGAIEQDADLVLMLYREEFYRSHLDRNDPKFLEVQGQAEVIVAKQRNGPTGVVKLSFVNEFARFENLSKHHRELPPGVEATSGPDMPF